MADDWIRQVRAAGAVPTGVEVAPAATVALLRDGRRGLEVLLARRSSRLAFHGGAWVFPGGRIDPDDFAGDTDDVAAAARRAAAREALEEARTRVDPDALVPLSHWTTPEISPKRFATWFFAGPASEDRVVADGTETEALAWFRPAEALAARAEGSIELAPPQFVSLLVLDEYPSVGDALAGIAARDPFVVTPRFCFLDDGAAVCIYDDDVAYDDPEPDLARPGRRHRLVMTEARWEYERDG